ncbi:hypothetical protein G3I19_00220 [Streptomyces sp. SID10853]|nr:hypothetical protein [Streptomyces sp. SID10853]
MWQGRQTRTAIAAQHGAEQAASALVLHLQGGGDLAPVPVTDLPLADEESAYADVLCSTARFYGSETVLPPSRAGYYENHPTFGRRWVPNRRLDARRREEAAAAAAERWRDQTPARVVLTSTGLRLMPAGSPKTWLPFDHTLLTGVTTGSLEVVLTYSVCAPLLLAGPAAPWLGVAIDYLHRIAL